jgi:putative oxidoreductase
VPETSNRYLTFAHNALRIALGLTYASHGAQKILGWFGGVGPSGGPVPFLSRFGAAGVIELVAGTCIGLGLFTRPLAFIASGEMAVAYFWMHWSRSGQMWWWQNHGELPMIYAFVWLFFAAAGAGTCSADAWLARRRAST